MPVANARAREKVERMYECSLVYHRLHCSLWNLALPGTIFSVSAASVLGFYVGLRGTELPWYFYWVFWIAGFGGLGQLSLLGHDVMFVKQASEEVVEQLQSPTSADLQAVSREERKQILKRRKHLTGLQFRISSFNDYTWDVVFGTCDEVLNQLMFFLNL